MDKHREEVTGLSEEELQKEADTVREMLEQSPELQEIEIPEELERKLADRIRKYEEEKAIDALSEKDKEALRLGRELQEKENDGKQKTKKNRIRIYWPKTWKVRLAFVAIGIMVIGSGIISVGGKEIIVNVFDRKFGGGEKTYVDTEDSTLPTTEEGMTEEEAYAKIEETFGTKVVRMVYAPENTEFLEMEIDKNLKEALVYYLVDGKIFTYRIIAKYTDGSVGIEVKDTLLKEYTMKMPEADILISEYKIANTGELEYIAQYTYKNNKYFLTGIVKQEEFEKIINNLNFF